MKNNIKDIQSFVLKERPYFESKGGIDVNSLMRRYKAVESLSIGRSDASEALTSLRRYGILSNNFKTMKMHYTSE